MKKQILLPFVLLALIMVFFLSCKKESVMNMTAQNSDEIINVKISPNQSYQMDVAGASNINISRQAAHFLTSEVYTNETGMPSYKYVPTTDFTGSDEVKLVSSKIVTNYTSNGGGCGSGNNGNSTTTSISSKYITLKITVGQ